MREASAIRGAPSDSQARATSRSALRAWETPGLQRWRCHGLGQLTQGRHRGRQDGGLWLGISVFLIVPRGDSAKSLRRGSGTRAWSPAAGHQNQGQEGDHRGRGYQQDSSAEEQQLHRDGQAKAIINCSQLFQN